jgi:hypothetical protein
MATASGTVDHGPAIRTGLHVQVPDAKSGNFEACGYIRRIALG